MKCLNILLIISLISCGKNISTNEKLQTVEGVARESKAGLVVEGVVIKGLDYNRVEYYRDKKIRVRGFVTEKHPWRTDGNKNEPIKTGFNMPVMMKILEIQLVEKK